MLRLVVTIICHSVVIKIYVLKERNIKLICQIPNDKLHATSFQRNPPDLFLNALLVNLVLVPNHAGVFIVLMYSGLIQQLVL